MLKDTLISDQNQALKSGRAKELETLRYILAQLKNKEIEKRQELTDEEALSVLRKTAKELAESIEAFEKGGRSDLVNAYKAQLELVSKYLPAEISDEELKNEISKIIENNRELYQKNPKVIIGICIKEIKGRANPQRIMKILQAV